MSGLLRSSHHPTNKGCVVPRSPITFLDMFEDKIGCTISGYHLQVVVVVLRNTKDNCNSTTAEYLLTGSLDKLYPTHGQTHSKHILIHSQLNTHAEYIRLQYWITRTLVYIWDLEEVYHGCHNTWVTFTEHTPPSRQQYREKKHLSIKQCIVESCDQTQCLASIIFPSVDNKDI